MNLTLSLLFLTLLPSFAMSGGPYAYVHFEKSAITVNEGDGEISVKIVRTGDTQAGGTFKVTASHNTTDDQDVDLTQEIRPVTFVSGELEKSITILIIDNDRVESEPKVFNLVLTRTGSSIPSIAIVEPSMIAISIEDNDVAIQPPTDAIPSGGAIEMEEEAKLTVLCEEDSISVSFRLNDYPTADTDTAHLEEEGCKPEVVNEIVSFKFGLQACGTKRSKSSNGEYIVYKNAINMKMKYATPDNDTISRSHSVVFPFKCSFKNKARVGTVSYNPRLVQIKTSTAAYGNFTYTMDMYKSDRYEEIEEYPAVKFIGQTMYLQLKVDSGDNQLVLFPDWCKATLSPDHSSEPHHMIMEKTCSRDNTLDFLYLPSFQQRFSLVAFRFTENYDDVYLHCQVTVCRSTDTESRCAKGCLRDTYRKRREVSDEMAQTLYVGPITLVKGHNAGAPAVSSSSSSNVSTVTLVAVMVGLLALVLLIFIVGLIVIVRNRRVPSIGTLLVQEG